MAELGEFCVHVISLVHYLPGIKVIKTKVNNIGCGSLNSVATYPSYDLQSPDSVVDMDHVCKVPSVDRDCKGKRMKTRGNL